MQLSTKVRYAVRAMIELALHYDQGPQHLKEIARRQEISEKYLEQIMRQLRAQGYVNSKKGSCGGYFLAKPPREITVYDLVQAMEGPLVLVACIDNPQACSRLNICAARDVWSRFNDHIARELSSTTLADLAREQKNKYLSSNESLVYYI
jgi:Rrf2 family protein